MFEIQCNTTVFYVGTTRKDTFDAPVPIYGVDRMSSVRHAVAQVLKINPDFVYAELVVNEKLRIFPFDIVFDRRFGAQYSDSVELREQPSEYNQQTDGVQIGQFYVPRSLFSISRKFPQSRESDFIYIRPNTEYIAAFVQPEDRVQIQVLVIEEAVVTKVRELLHSREYKVPCKAALLRHFPRLVMQLPGFKDDTAFVQEQDQIRKLTNDKTAVLAKPFIKFHFNVIELLHILKQPVELRKIFNDVSIANGIDFVKHVYTRESTLADGSVVITTFQATKFSTKDKVEMFEVSTANVNEPEHVTFGLMGLSLTRIFKSGVVQFIYNINQTRDSNIQQAELDDLSQAFAETFEFINKLPSQYTQLTFDTRYLQTRAHCDLYISFKEVQPVFTKRALQDILTTDDSTFVIKARVMSDTDYTVRLQNTADYMVIKYEGAFTSHFYIPFCAIPQLLAKQYSKHASTNVREREYYEAHDPVLYKHLNKPYYRLCQGNRQPRMVKGPGQYTHEYWNFTNESKQYYQCNSEFPYMYFITGNHKKNYCVPCCTMVQHNQRVYKSCQETHKFTQNADEKRAKHYLKKEGLYQLGRDTLMTKALADYFDHRNVAIHCTTQPESRDPNNYLESLAVALEYLINVPKLSNQLRSLKADDSQVWIDYAALLIDKHFKHKVMLLVINIDEQTFYARNFNREMICVAQTGNVFNPITFGQKLLIQASTFRKLDELQTHIQRQLQQNPDRVLEFFSKQFPDFEVQQIVDRNSFCRYLVGAGSKGYVVLPVLPQIAPEIPIADKFPDANQLVITAESVQELTHKLHLQIEYRVSDHQEQLCGVIAGNLFIPIKPQPLNSALLQHRIFASRINPMTFYNQLVVFTSTSQTSSVGTAVLSIYIDYLYELMLMQNPVREDDIIMMPLNELIKHIQSRASVPAELRSCKHNSDQFFCSGNKLVIADIHRDLLKEFTKTRRQNPNIQTPVALILAEIEFKTRPGEIIIIDRLSTNTESEKSQRSSLLVNH